MTSERMSSKDMAASSTLPSSASNADSDLAESSYEALRNLIGFLRDPKPKVRASAVQGMVSQSSTPEGQQALLTAVYKDTVAEAGAKAKAVVAGVKYKEEDGGKKFIRRAVPELCRLVGDLNEIAPGAITALINLSGSDAGLGQMISEPKLINRLMENLSLASCPFKRISLMLLSNLTRSFQGAMLFLACDVPQKELQGLNLMRLIVWFLENPARRLSSEEPSKSPRAKALDVVLDEKEEEASLAKMSASIADGDSGDFLSESGNGDEWEFVAGILANITRIKEGRLFVLDWDRGIVARLLPTLTKSTSVVRRRGIARMLRNICTEYEYHPRLLSPVKDGGVDLLHHALMSLSGPPAAASDPLGEHEKDPLHPELYSADKHREPDIVVRKKVVEMLVVLTHSRASRELMRARKVYPIVREMHSATNLFIEKTRRARGELDENSNIDDEESSAFDEIMFRLVDHIAAEEAPEMRSRVEDQKAKAKMERQSRENSNRSTTNPEKNAGEEEDEIKERGHGSDEEEDDSGYVRGPREYEVGFAYSNEPVAATLPEDEDDEDDEGIVFTSNMVSVGDSSESDSDSESDNSDSESNAGKSAFTVKTITIEEREQKAYDLKEAGNKKYGAKEYSAAVSLYRQACQWMPPPRLTAICRSNESAALGALGRWSEAAKAAQQCVDVDFHFPKGYVRWAKALEKVRVAEEKKLAKVRSAESKNKSKSSAGNDVLDDDDSGGAEAILQAGIKALRGQDPKKLHPVHVRAVPWPDWLNEGIALLEKTLEDTRARSDKRGAKRQAREEALLKAKAESQVENARMAAAEMQKLEEEAKRDAVKRSAKKSAMTASRTGGEMTPEMIAEINKVVRQRREAESQHRSTAFELERIQKDSRAAQLSLQTLDAWLSRDAQQGESSSLGDGESRSIFGAAGKCFIREDPGKLMSELQSEIKEMERKKEMMQRREKQLVAHLEEIQRDLDEMAGARS